METVPMRDLERAGYLAHARSPTFMRRVDGARGCIREALELAPAYVACSWGKDSVALAHLVYAEAPDVPVVFFSHTEDALIDNYDAVKSAYYGRFPGTYLVVSMAGDHVPGKVRQAALWESFPVAFVGIRAEEAAGRRMEYRRHGAIHRYVTGAAAGSWRAWPLARWTWQDVWAYTCQHVLPYLASYDHPQARERARSRTNNHLSKDSPYGRVPDAYGRIAEIRRTNPGYFHYLQQFYPEIARLSG